MGGQQWKNTGFSIGFNALEQFLGIKKGTFRINIKFNLLVPRNLSKRRQVRAIDIKVQEQTTKNVLNQLLNADSKDCYLDEVDVSLTKNGLIFVPKGVSKQAAINKFCAQKHVNNKNMILHGDDFDDFFLPVSLRELDNAKKQAEQEGKSFDAFETFLKLSKPALDEQTFLSRALAYNIDQNPTFASLMLEKKFSMAADDYNNSVLETVKKQQIDEEEQQAKQKLDTKFADLDNEYKQKIDDEKDIVKKSDLKLDLEEKKAEVQKEFDETMQKAKEETEKLTVKDINPEFLKTGTTNNGNMLTLKHLFTGFTNTIAAIRAQAQAQNPSRNP